MEHYFKNYQNVEIVKCINHAAYGFTVGKEYQVLETRTKLVQVGYADKKIGAKDEFCKFTDIYMMNDKGEFTNAAEPTDFEIIK